MNKRAKKPIIQIDVLTLFPGMFNGPLTESLMGRAQDSGLARISIHSIRKWSDDKRHAKVDDRPYGGGAGMVLRPEPVFRAIQALKRQRKVGRQSWVVYLSPKGTVFNQTLAQQISKKKHLIFLCGHYEGLDERVLKWVDQEISIGDFILTGGEIPAMALVDAVVRLVPGVVGDPRSIMDESFSRGLLEYPHYTRPAVWRGKAVPPVLLSGNHRDIEAWRGGKAVEATRKRRPDLLGRGKRNGRKI